MRLEMCAIRIRSMLDRSIDRVWIDKNCISIRLRCLALPAPLTAYKLIIRPQLALELIQVVQGLHGR